MTISIEKDVVMKEHLSSSFQNRSVQERLTHAEALPSEEKWAQGLVLGDEWANSLTHGIGLMLSIVGFILLVSAPIRESDHWRLINLGVYGASLILLYAASTFYHAVKQPKWKKILRTIDHCAIYLLIAGSYTPFTMLLLEGFWGIALFCTVWSLACLGIIFKIFFKHRFMILSTSIYLLMGWLVLIATEPLIASFHLSGLCWLVAGGLCYTLGVIFFALDRRRYYHAIWHVFVLSGSICHFFAVFFYL